MSGNLESRLRKLEQDGAANARLIVLAKAEDEDTGQILEANGITTVGDDLVISVVRFAVEGGRMPPLTERIISMQDMGAAA